jgi:hypothetical protein
MISPPASARDTLITDALVSRSAAAVTGYAAPAQITATASTAATQAGSDPARSVARATAPPYRGACR